MTKSEIHAAVCGELTALYERKNHDYGDSFTRNYNEFGIVYSIMHFQEKLDRLKSLMTKDAQVTDESITDTLMDMANYAIMTMVEHRIAAGETPVVEKGDHDSDCSNSCLCTSCVHDHDSDFSKGIHACCTTHGFDCKVTSCPDYQKEAE